MAIRSRGEAQSGWLSQMRSAGRGRTGSEEAEPCARGQLIQLGSAAQLCTRRHCAGPNKRAILSGLIHGAAIGIRKETQQKKEQQEKINQTD